MSDIERLVALEEGKLLKARRDRYGDTKRWDDLEGLHAPDHVSYNDDYPPWTMAADIVANVRVIMDRLRTAHHSHPPEIAVAPAQAEQWLGQIELPPNFGVVLPPVAHLGPMNEPNRTKEILAETEAAGATIVSLVHPTETLNEYLEALTTVKEKE